MSSHMTLQCEQAREQTKSCFLQVMVLQLKGVLNNFQEGEQIEDLLC